MQLYVTTPLWLIISRTHEGKSGGLAGLHYVDGKPETSVMLFSAEHEVVSLRDKLVPDGEVVCCTSDDALANYLEECHEKFKIEYVGLDPTETTDAGLVATGSSTKIVELVAWLRRRR